MFAISRKIIAATLIYFILFGIVGCSTIAGLNLEELKDIVNSTQPAALMR